MLKIPRKTHNAQFKAKVALEAIKGEKTLNELATTFGVHSNQISLWKNQVLNELPQLFSSKREENKKDEEALKANLYQQIGQLKVELDWLKKKVGYFD